MMNTSSFAAVFFCLSLALGQDHSLPFTKEQILKLVKSTAEKRAEQRELAGEIAMRGITFPADEKTMEELRQAGAPEFVLDSIKKAVTQNSSPSTKSVTPKFPSEAEINKLSLPERAATRVAMFIEELPNFVVTQTLTRSVRKPDKKDWQAQDKLEVELTYSHKNAEKHQLKKINDRPTSQSFESVNGSTSQGEFGGTLGFLLDPRSRPEFKELKQENYRGRATQLYQFRVRKIYSSYKITSKPSGRSVTTGCLGTVWVDLETARILRLEISAEEVQPDFPINISENAVEYDWVTIAEKKYWMPISSETIMGSDITRYYERNVVEFKNYRMFETGVKILEGK